MKKKYKFLNLCILSTESLLAIWPFPVQVSYKWISYKKSTVIVKNRKQVQACRGQINWKIWVISFTVSLNLLAITDNCDNMRTTLQLHFFKNEFQKSKQK